MKMFWCVWCIFLGSIGAAAYAQDTRVPVNAGWVNDFASIVSWEYKDAMSRLITELEAKTGVEIAVATFSTIKPYDEAEFSRMVFDSWKIGKKNKDNGALIMVVVDDRLWRISTGYGLEGILPDGLCGQIGRTTMVPYFKKGEYDKGLYQGLQAVIQIVAQKYGVVISEQPRVDQTPSERPGNPLFTIIIIVIAVLVSRRSRSWRRGGWVIGGTGGGFGSHGGFGGFGGGSFGGGGAGGRF